LVQRYARRKRWSVGEMQLQRVVELAGSLSMWISASKRQWM